jgi:penicillin-binding protein 2
MRIASEPRAAVVALDVRSGEVVVMASVPTFDPNDLTANFDDAVWQRLQADPHKPLLNRAIAGLYPPGSTFKMVTALAALEAGAVTLEEAVTCRGVYHFADQSYRCWKRDGHGRVGLDDAIRESCDVYFYDLAERIGINRIAAMARRLGLGQTYACGIAGQKDGLIPDTDWKRATLGKTWLRGETILAGIGQGYVLTTPLQLAVMTARLATGRAVVPTLVRKPGTALPEGPLFPALAVAPEGLEAVRRAMVGVVNEAGGTGGNASLADRAVVIAGKTGTSQVRATTSARSQTGEDAFEHRDHALFVSYFPADAPRYAVAAVVEHGGGGGVAAAPIVRDVIAMLIADDPAARASWDGGSSP